MPQADPCLPTPLRVAQLRDLLGREYPDAHRSPAARGSLSAARVSGFLATENLTLKSLAGQVTEITGGEAAVASPGMGLILHHLLEQAAAAGRGLVLVDEADCFDPQSYPSALCRNLFWARCGKTGAGLREAASLDTALKVVDLFLRDGNLPLIILDLFQTPVRELARINLGVWYRLRQRTEQSGCGLCLLSARSTCSAAHRRFALAASFALDDLERPRSELLPELQLRVERAQPRWHPETISAPTRRIA